MNKYILLAVLALMYSSPIVAWSQGLAGANTGTPPAAAGQGQFGDGPQFQARKAEILQRMNSHIAEIQQRQACVQAAGNREALMGCLPQRVAEHEVR